MPRSGLFLRIFGWFWVALAGTLGALLLTMYVFDAEMVSTSWNPVAGNTLMKPYADEAVRRYTSGGPEGLTKYLQGRRASTPGQVYLFDAAGKELTGQTASPRIADLAASLKKPSGMEVRLSIRHGLVGTALTGPDSKRYSFIIELDRRPTVLPALGPRFLWSAGLSLIVLALLCYLIARQLAMPVMRVSMASAARIETLVKVQERLLWDISHELRSPLTRLSLALGIARRKAGSEAKPALDRIEMETERLNGLIQQLLTIARIKGGAGPMMNERIDLAAVVAEVAMDADFEARGRNRSVCLTTGLSTPSACEAAGSRDLLKSAIENVVRNAIRHTLDGTEVAVDLSMDERMQMAVISVRDHGPGVPEPAIGRLFETFFRVPEGGETDGAGLGLAITQQAVLAHSGWVRARNAEGGGLLVQLGVPLVAARVAGSEPVLPVPETDAGGREAREIFQ